ncbi:GNAT family N-acetyltransferase [Candidatus Desulfosporosinus nitrosoreducens]|uniref:GNAT family N-acetyltransferase n=1 Tax=Candidatus Desulfosporosinus nitrosoreducens TaxID=3401928 RepID=UPI00280A9396|nr:GNAT family N-acetyltransferase [Desulfosporosinus sp. PR]
MGSVRFWPFPELKTKRLTLKKLVQADADGIFALRSNCDVIKYTGIKQYTTVNEAKSYIQRIEHDLEGGQCIMWSISLTSTEEFIGSICLWNISEDGSCAEIGYDLLPFFQGKGFMQEAVHSVIRYGFGGMKLGKIVADLRTENIRSVKLLEKNGFQKSKIHTLANENGDKVEMALYFLERTDFEYNIQ